MSRYRFALRPKWVFGHLLVAALLITFVSCGFWQLRRLDQRKSFNHLVRHNQALPVTGVDHLGLRADQGTGHAKALQGRRVRITGTYLSDRSVVITGQSVNSQPGVWILTPLQVNDGPVVLVNRGFLIDDGGLHAPPASTEPPSGTVTVEGSVQPTETPSVFQKRDAAGHQTSYRRIDVDRIRGALGVPTLPLWVLATSQKPADPGKALAPVPPPELTNGPHLNYAIQWFGFTVVGIVGYPILLRRKARDRERGGDDDDVLDLTGGGAEVDASLAAEELTTTP